MYDRHGAIESAVHLCNQILMHFTLSAISVTIVVLINFRFMSFLSTAWALMCQIELIRWVAGWMFIDNAFFHQMISHEVQYVSS